MNKEILKKIIEILKSEHFNMNDTITKDSEIKMFSGWDSLKHLMFLMEIEKKFKIGISPEEAPLIITINDLVEKIKKK
ncbi:acyl carrier protein [Candidatus Parcubacteria bacterium]|nr:acyl carrier protein [Candidatus Parcubacteria bacterium]